VRYIFLLYKYSQKGKEEVKLSSGTESKNVKIRMRNGAGHCSPPPSCQKSLIMEEWCTTEHIWRDKSHKAQQLGAWDPVFRNYALYSIVSKSQLAGCIPYSIY
jgi:hypothetical protein